MVRADNEFSKEAGHTICIKKNKIPMNKYKQVKDKYLENCKTRN